MDQKFVYAGFWKRFLAYIIDEIIISAVASILLIPLSILLGIGIFSSYMIEEYEYYSTVSFFSASVFQRYNRTGNFSVYYCDIYVQPGYCSYSMAVSCDNGIILETGYCR